MGAGMGSSITITDDAGAHLLAHVLRHALDGAAPQVGEQLRTGIVRDRDTAADVYKRQITTRRTSTSANPSVAR